MKKYNLAPGDFPDIRDFQEKLSEMDFTKFHGLKQKLIDDIEGVLGNDIPRLMEGKYFSGTYSVFYFIALDYTVLQCIALYCIVLHCSGVYCTVLYCTVLYCTVLYCTVLYCNKLQSIVLQYTVLAFAVSAALSSSVLYATLGLTFYFID